MNDLGREKLVAAALQGVKQVKGAYRTSEGLCALGVLGWDNNLETYTNLENTNRLRELYELREDYRAECPCCGLLIQTEVGMIIHLNDDHGLDFLTIARKL